MPDPKSTRKIPRFIWVIGMVVVVVVVAAAIVGLMVTQAAPPQPMPYNHKVHVSHGIQCIFCHSAPTRSSSAGLPTRSKCLGCHGNMKNDTPEQKATADYLYKHEKLEWVPVAIMPDFVYFSHQPHIAAGVACQTCHGDVANMAAAEPQKNQNMGWCLNCHKTQAPEKVEKLTDCATCHK